MKQPELSIPVLLADLERFAPSPVAEFVAGKTVVDALGRAWVPDEVARAALAKADQVWRQELADRAAYARWIDDRADRRKALAERLRDKVLAGGSLTPASSGEVYERRRAALEEFDERNPELGYYEWRDKR
jgi:alpha-mannosidase